MTLKKLRINFGKKEMSNGLTYVALSRVKTLEGLLIDHNNFTVQRLSTIKLHEDMIFHDRNSKKIEEDTEKIIDKFYENIQYMKT